MSSASARSRSTTTTKVPVHRLPSLQIHLTIPFPPETVAVGDLATYSFGANASTSVYKRNFGCWKDIVPFANLGTSVSSPFIIATARATGGSDATGVYQSTVHWKQLAQYPGCDPCAIRNATIRSGLIKVPCHFKGGGMEPLKTPADILPAGFF